MKFEGKVINGVSVGAKFGIATANLEIVESDSLDLKQGVYFVGIRWYDQCLNGLLHYGDRKTFGGDCTAEVHILDFSEDIYGEVLEVEVLKYERDVRTFQNADALFTQVEKDIVRAEKFFLRRSIYAQWDQVEDAQEQEWASLAVEKIEQMSEFQFARHVLIYAPIDNEIPFVEALCDKYSDKTYYFPKIIAIEGDIGQCLQGSAKMYFFASKYSALRFGKYGILEPADGNKCDLSKIDLAFIPAVAVDKNLNRLGRGGGFYDRVLVGVSCSRVVVLPEFAVVEELPVEKWDERMSYVISV